MPNDRRPIAVFDSGLGGLTVVRELRDRLPREDIVYFGDTARVPYGNKARETVFRFTRENCAFLLRTDPKCIVAACNTASAVCLPALADELPVPVFGVVEPGAAAAVRALDEPRGFTAGGRGASGVGQGRAAGADGLIAIIATEATIASNAYKNAVFRINPRPAVIQVACPLLVPLVEEGLDEASPIVRLVLERYLGPVRRLSPAVVVLGCTHYPMLRSALASYLGGSVVLVDSASSTAAAVASTLEAADALSGSAEGGSLHCYVSDNPRRFQNVGSRFLGESIPDVVRVCPEELAEARLALGQPRASA